MRWQDIDRTNGVWRKPNVKSTKGGLRGQALPLSDAAMALLKDLPGWGAAKPDHLAFPNGSGARPLDNWTRFCAELSCLPLARFRRVLPRFSVICGQSVSFFYEGLLLESGRATLRAAAR